MDFTPSNPFSFDKISKMRKKNSAKNIFNSESSKNISSEG